jgi:hypothetical protein
VFRLSVEADSGICFMLCRSLLPTLPLAPCSLWAPRGQHPHPCPGYNTDCNRIRMHAHCRTGANALLLVAGELLKVCSRAAAAVHHLGSLHSLTGGEISCVVEAFGAVLQLLLQQQQQLLLLLLSLLHVWGAAMLHKACPFANSACMWRHVHV